MTEAPQDNGMPRGVLAVVAVGLLACVLAALLATDKGSGEAADLEWIQFQPIADSRAVEVPGGGGKMQLTEGGIRATGTNAGGFSLYRALSVLKIDAGAPVGSARISCSTRAPEGTEIAQTHSLRASYPRPSEELYEQEVPEVVLLEFSSHGDELAVVETGDFPARFATEREVNLEWPEYESRHEAWKWFLPPGKPAAALSLPFATIWKTTAIPAVRIACTLTTAAGTATVQTKGALAKRTEPIAE